MTISSHIQCPVISYTQLLTTIYTYVCIHIAISCDIPIQKSFLLYNYTLYTLFPDPLSTSFLSIPFPSSFTLYCILCLKLNFTIVFGKPYRPQIHLRRHKKYPPHFSCEEISRIIFVTLPERLVFCQDAPEYVCAWERCSLGQISSITSEFNNSSLWLVFR